MKFLRAEYSSYHTILLQSGWSGGLGSGLREGGGGRLAVGRVSVSTRVGNCLQ